MNTHLRLAERFVLLRETGDEYRVLSAFECVSVRVEHGTADLLDRVLPLLRDGLAEDELRAAVGTAAAEDLDRLLAELVLRGLIERIEATPISRHVALDDPVTAQQRYLANFMPFQDRPPEPGERLRPNGAEIQARLAAATTLLVGDGHLTGRAATQLRRAGLHRIQILIPEPGSSGEKKLAAGLKEAELAVVCPDHHRVSLLRTVNRACLERNVTWTSARTLGARVEVGPTVVPGETACFDCYEQRRQSNYNGYREDAERAERLALQGLDTGRLAVEAADGILVAEVLKLVGGFSRPMTYGSLFSLDLITLESRLHPVLKIPRCASCGAPARNQPTTSVWPFSP